MPIVQEGEAGTARAHDQAHARAGDNALRLGAPELGEVTDRLCHALAKSECCEQPNTCNCDCKKETVGKELITCPHDRTPLPDYRAIIYHACFRPSSPVAENGIVL
jgi:hypothetical protein